MRHRRRPYRGYDDDDPDSIGETLADVNDRLDDLALQISRIARRNSADDRDAPQRTNAAERDDADNLGKALAELNRRLDQIEKSERSAAPPRARTEWLPEFDQARPAPIAATPSPPISVECTQDLSSLENHLRQITEQIAALNMPCQIDDVVLGLRTDLAEIGRAFNDAMPRRSVEMLEKEVRALSERIDRSRESGVSGAKLAQLEHALVEMHDTLRNLKPAENLVEVSEAVKNLARKIDQITASDHNPAALQKLDQVIAGLRGIVAHVASNDAVGKLATEVRNLAARIDQATPESNAQAISNLDQRITSLMGARQSASPELAMQISELDRKFDQRIAALMGASQSGSPEVATHIQALGEHLDRRLDTLIGASQPAAPEVATHIQALGEHLDRRLDSLASASQPAAPEVAAHIQALGEHIDNRIDALMGSSQPASRDMSAQIQALAEHLDQRISTLTGANQSASPDVAAQMKAFGDRLEQRIAELLGAGQRVSPELATQIKTLGEKLESFRPPQGDKVALSSIEDRIVKLAGKLDESGTVLGRLGAIERGMADLLVCVEDARTNALRQTQEPPQNSDRQVHQEPAQKIDQEAEQQSETRLHMRDQPRHRLRDVLPETPHSAMTNGAAGLPNIETATVAPAQPSAPEAEAEAEPEPMPVAHESVHEVAAAAPVAEAEPEPAAASASSPIYASVLDPDAAALRDPLRRPIDPSLPPDTPIEPSPEASHVRASAAQRITASEAVLGTAKPAAREVASQFETLIAARRAAFQAGAEASATTESTVKPGLAAKPASQLGKRVRTYLRWTLLLASLVIIIWGALWVGLDMWGSDGSASPPVAADQPETQQRAAPEPARPAIPTPAPAPGKNMPTMPMPAPGPEPGPSTPLNDLPSNPPANGSSGNDPLDDVIVKPTPEVTGALPKQIPDPNRPPAELTLPASIGGPGLRAAAIAGNSAAEYEIAVRFAEGRGTTANIEESARWLERAARAGFVPAQFRLGGLYDKGGGLKRDRALARQFYSAAAEKGHAKAMHNLAVLYAEGIDGKPNYKMAAQWFRRAAEYGIADSQYNLAILYIRGIGVDQNLVESYKWFALAANQGDHEAAKKREEVAERLDEQSLNAANQAVQTFVIAQQPDQAVNLRTPLGGWDRANANAQPSQPRSRPSHPSTPNSLLSPAPL